LSPRIFTEITPPPGSDGGLANALVGSTLMSLLGVLIGPRSASAAGTYLAEFAERRPVWRESVRFVNDILLSAPSIVLGLFVYRSTCARSGISPAWPGPSRWADRAPVVVRTTDETLRLVPNMMRRPPCRSAYRAGK